MPLEKRLFTGGMDQDNEQRLVESTSYRYALNVRALSSEDDNIGAIELVKGNTLVQFALPIGVNRVIGSYDYKAYNKCYYFIYNSFLNHSILEYTPSSNTIKTVLTNSVLNFNTDYLITGINVVELDSDNHLLYWTDDYNEPRKINIEKGILHSLGDYVNGYANPFLESFIFRVKDPPSCQPECVYGNDSTKNINLLDNKLFQFKTAFIYDDFEKSATSPISKIPFPSLVCGNNPIPYFNNKIDVTFDTGSTIVKKIIVYGREGNTGDFFKIDELDKEKLSIASNAAYTFSFYNDKVYNTEDINFSIKLFDNVPLKSKAQEIIEGSRIVDGNILEGYDPVSVDASLSLSYDQTASTRLFKFKGRIYIGNFFVSDAEFQYGQPIHDPTGTGNTPMFGGFGKSSVIDTVGAKYNQGIPLKGFVAYLVGTPYYAISVQNAPTNLSGDSAPLAGNVYNSNNAKGRRTAIRSAISNKQVYSEFSFSNIPAGKYILRIASHLITQNDLDSGNFDWQKTSTNTICVGGDKNHECEITVDQNGTITTPYKTFSSGGYLNPSMVMDASNPQVGATSSAITGYVTDADIASPSPNTKGYLADTRIELARVSFHLSTGNSGYHNSVLATAGYGIGFVRGSSVEIGVTDLSASKAFTDHNGYFYVCSISAPGNSFSVTSITSGIYALNQQNLQYDTPTSSLTPVTGSSGGSKIGIFRNTNPDVTSYSRTTLLGKIVFGGSGVIGMGVVSTRGGIDTTAADGSFNLIVYADTRNSSGAQPRADRILYLTGDDCIATFSPVSDSYNIWISSTATGGLSTPQYNGTYNNTSQLLYVNVQLVTITSVIGGRSDIGFKRGSSQQFGIVYYNHSNRSGLTNTKDSLKLDIPFFTEISTPNAVPNGKPIIDWAITSLPPLWATHYQWVRTLNSVPNRYLQFSAKNVSYVKDDRTTVPYSQATKIGINIQNIANYKTLHGDSLVAYAPEPGDRVRFISDSNGSFFNSYIDLKIRDIDPAGIVYVDYISNLPILQSGFLFEIYTPKLQSKDQIYYEFGECYEVGDAGLSSRYHKGVTQDQDPNNPVLTPATGTFTGGDTYRRLRNIPFGGTVPTSSNNSAPWFIEDASFSDFYSSKSQDIGRPNKVDDTFMQIRRKSTIYYSDKFIPETRINGLSSVYDTSFETYEAQYGGIQKLNNEDLRLDCFQELKIGSIPVNQVQFQSTDASGASVVGSSDKVLNPIIYYKGEYGISLNPESFAVYAGSRYCFDVNRGVALRLAADGLNAISEYKMHNYFSDKSKAILATGVKANIYGTFDVRFGEYVLSFSDSTVAFNEKYNAWSTFYSYLPENMCTSGLDIVTFKDGGIYVHNSNSIYNNFYGVQYSSELWVVSNGEPSKNKALQAISLECSEAWDAYDISTENGQSTSLESTDYEKKQNLMYAGVMRDANTPNVTDPLIEGDEMVDTSFLIKLSKLSLSFVKLFCVNLYWQPQERSNK